MGVGLHLQENQVKQSNRAKAAEILVNPRQYGPEKVAWAMDQMKPVKPLKGQQSLFKPRKEKDGRST